eukprot:PLAT12017.1.p1 GENE.PLAT12017.1~~PLAT12017.1.p1  ORF type:complete len:145 (+),score=61.75 PLAT12017.1:40-435(+)
MADDFVALASDFCTHYYNLFDNDRWALKELYTEESMLTFQEEEFMGPDAIIDKLLSLGSPKGDGEDLVPAHVEHDPQTLDVQPGPTEGSILALVTGELSIDGDRPIKFAQTFQLVPIGDDYVIFNDLFRLG